MGATGLDKKPAKTLITFEASKGTDTFASLASEWAAKEGFAVTKVRLIRALGRKLTGEVFYVNAADIAEQEDKISSALKPDFERDALLTPFGIATLKDRYLLPTETSPQQGFMRAAKAFADDEAHAARLYNYASKLWFMFATPVLSNPPDRYSFGKTFEENFQPEHFDSRKRGMPISCFLNYVPDSRKGITEHYSENAWLSSIGGGIGAYWGAIRSNGKSTSGGSASSGVIPFMGVMDRMVMAFAQGVTRRASYAMYLDVSHPEIMEFIEIRKPTGGDANRKSLNLHNAVNIPDAFMEIIENCMKDPDADDTWPLIDPHTNEVVANASAKEIWQKLLDVRMQTGEPYIMFVDTVNEGLPQQQRDLGLRCYHSNLCTEITLATDEERTAVCCLSSVNLEYFDEWSKDEMFIEDLVRMLDNVLEYFILNAPDTLAKAKFSAQRERSIGLGAMGFHSYLQRVQVPFESGMATSLNRKMFGRLKTKALEATRKLAVERGACPDAGAEQRRNMHLLSVAPNASSSIICGGTSPACEPYRANAYTHKTQSGSWLVRNKYLEMKLEEYGQNTDEVWQSIILNKGSAQHLTFMTEDDRAIFKTSIELDQLWIIEHAGHRQENICQSQSVNVFLRADCSIPELHAVHFMAWKRKLKTLYYLRSEAIRRAEAVSSTTAVRAMPTTAELTGPESVCLSCEG